MKSMSAAPGMWLRSGARSTLLRAAWHYLPIAIVLLVWQVVVEFDLVDRAFLPSFGETLSALWEMTRNGEIGFNLLVSIYRAFAGLANSRCLSTPAAVAAIKPLFGSLANATTARSISPAPQKWRNTPRCTTRIMLRCPTGRRVGRRRSLARKTGREAGLSLPKVPTPAKTCWR